MVHYPWVNIHDWAGVNLDGLPAEQRGLDTIGQRPAAQCGLAILNKEEHSTREFHDWINQFRSGDKK